MSGQLISGFALLLALCAVIVYAVRMNNEHTRLMVMLSVAMILILMAPMADLAYPEHVVSDLIQVPLLVVGSFTLVVAVVGDFMRRRGRKSSSLK